LQYLAMSENPSENSLAVRHLAGTLSRAVERLNHHSDLKPGLYQAAAGEEITWPILHSPSHFFATDRRKVQEKLSVGSDYSLHVLGPEQSGRNPMILRCQKTNWFGE
jgi:hypothetical protein